MATYFPLRFRIKVSIQNTPDIIQRKQCNKFYSNPSTSFWDMAISWQSVVQGWCHFLMLAGYGHNSKTNGRISIKLVALSQLANFRWTSHWYFCSKTHLKFLMLEQQFLANAPALHHTLPGNGHISKTSGRIWIKLVALFTLDNIGCVLYWDFYSKT